MSSIWAKKEKNIDPIGEIKDIVFHEAMAWNEILKAKNLTHNLEVQDNGKNMVFHLNSDTLKIRTQKKVNSSGFMMMIC